MAKILFFIVLSIFYNSFCFGNNQKTLPVLRFTLNNSDLGEIEKIIIQRYIKEREFSIETLVISEDIDILGKLDLILNNTVIKFTNKTNAEIFLTFVEEKNINFILNILNIEIYFDYDFETGLVSGKGNGSIFVKNVSLSLNNTIIQVQNLHEPEKKFLGLEIQSVLFNDLDMNISFSKNGTLEKVLRYFNKNLKTIALKIVEYQVNILEVRTLINDKLYEFFENMHLSVPVYTIEDPLEVLNVSFSMNEEPIIKNNMIEISLEGELRGNYYIYNETNNVNLPHLINNYDLLTDKTINGVISQFILNNALDFISYYGYLNIEITNNTLGLIELNVGTLSAIIPEITNGYSSSLKAKIITNSIKSPILILNKNNIINLTLYEHLKFFVYNNTENKNKDIGTIPIEADCQIEIEGNFLFNETNVQLNIKSISMKTFEVTKSLVGEINTSRVITNFKTFMGIVIGNINNNIKKIIDELPIPFIFEKINFGKLAVQSYDNYLKIDLSPTVDNLKIFLALFKKLLPKKKLNN